jgi:hypothetical protein
VTEKAHMQQTLTAQKQFRGNHILIAEVQPMRHSIHIIAPLLDYTALRRTLQALLDMV